MRSIVALALIALIGAACGREAETPRVRPLPKFDGSPALRGGGPARSKRIANYKIEAALDPVKHVITGSETLSWTNTGETSVDRLPFHLYLNAFKNDSTLFMRTSGGALRGSKASLDTWGWIQIDRAVVAGAEVTSKLVMPGTDHDETVVELPLAEPVAPGATIEVAFTFTAQLPEVFARTGYAGDFHLVGQWFPKIGVRVGPPGAERWECQPFHSHAEFFADFGTYDVTLTVPNTYVVAATGVLSAAKESANNTRTYTYRAEDVHDFVWMADPFMEVMSGQAKLEDGTVEVRVLYRPEQKEYAKRHLDAAVGAITKFSSMFTPYPWPILTVVDPPVEAAASAGGMEYPTLVTTAGDTVFARPGMRLPEFVTVHEIGHNWFQGLLASNEPAEAWLDEGVNDWADAKVMAELYGPRSSGIDWMGWQADVVALRRALADDPGSLPSPIATAAASFVDEGAYAIATYESTSRALLTLENVVGATRFAAAMKAYVKKFAFTHPTGRDLFDTLSKELDQDLAWFEGPVFHQVGGHRLAIRKATCERAHAPRGVFGSGSGMSHVTAFEMRGFSCEVVITNTGTIHVPVDIELRFVDGGSQRVRWDDRGTTHWQRFLVQRSTPLAEVRLDPDNKLALDSPMQHHHRIEGDGDASLRAASWFAAATQTLMQVIGL